MNVCKTCGKEIDFMDLELCVKCNETICSDCALDNKYMCTDCNVTKTEYAPEFIRRSHIEDYIGCPYYFYLACVKGLKEEFSPQITTGIILHELYEKWQKGEIEDEDEICDLSEELIRNENFDEEHNEKMVTRAIRSTVKFLETIPALNDMEEVVAIEETIFFPVSKDDSLPKVRITMDRIGRREEGLHIHDWKTGAVMTGKKLSSNLQVPLYIYAVEHQYDEPVQEFTLHYLDEGKTRTYYRIDEDTFRCTVRKRDYDISLQGALKEVQTVFARIKQAKFSIPDKPSFIKCKFCTFRKNQICMGSTRQAYEDAQDINAEVKSSWAEML